MSLIPPTANAIAIDPGYGRRSGGCACAEARSGVILHAWFERASEFVDGPAGIKHVVVEQPQQDARSWGIPPAVLIALAWEGAKLGGLYAGTCGAILHDPLVRDWKAGEKKPAHHKRLWAVLEPSERALLGGAPTLQAINRACEKGALCRWSLPSAQLYPSTFKTHNLLDAAALLAWALGRLTKEG